MRRLSRRCSWRARALAIPVPLGRQLSGMVVRRTIPRPGIRAITALAVALAMWPLACSPSEASMNQPTAAVDAYVRDWLRDNASGLSISAAAPLGVVIAVDGAATDPLRAQWAASNLPVQVMADSAATDALAGTLHVSLNAVEPGNATTVALVGVSKSTGSRCFTRDSRVISFTGDSPSVAKQGLWYGTP